MKKKINGAMKKKWGYERQIISDSDAIDSPRLKEIAELLEKINYSIKMKSFIISKRTIVRTIN
ncbi:MAG: hypothetical protein ACLRT0_14710 [Coprococcus sp.]